MLDMYPSRPGGERSLVGWCQYGEYHRTGPLMHLYNNVAELRHFLGAKDARIGGEVKCPAVSRWCG